MDDYRPRQAADFAYFNNHDYWAGWAVRQRHAARP